MKDVEIAPAPFGRQCPKPRELRGFACQVGGRQVVLGFINSHRLGAFEPLRQEMDQRRIAKILVEPVVETTSPPKR